ncbi:MAG: GNAT family N-acetyltransferase [Alistipes sp.]|nr:GNAT family N-acetyltransferase [Alistipes sp.]
MRTKSRDRELVARELRCAAALGRATRWPANIYTFDGACCPHLMREVWRLRGEAYRDVGVTLDDMGGNASDVDGTCRQLIVWDDVMCKIVGGYRYAVCADVPSDSLAVGRYFTLSERFVRDYLPWSLELGRSFVVPEYQSAAGRHTIYALDALWEGLGRVVMSLGVRYLFGRVTLYPSLGAQARDLLVGFMRYIFPSRESLLRARSPLGVGLSRFRCRQIFVGETLGENYRILISRMRDLQCAVPPIISSYMRLSPTMQTFDTYANGDLGNVAETAIMLTVDDFYDDIKRRYLSISVKSRRGCVWA